MVFFYHKSPKFHDGLAYRYMSCSNSKAKIHIDLPPCSPPPSPATSVTRQNMPLGWRGKQDKIKLITIIIIDISKERNEWYLQNIPVWITVILVKLVKKIPNRIYKFFRRKIYEYFSLTTLSIYYHWVQYVVYFLTIQCGIQLISLWRINATPPAAVSNDNCNPLQVMMKHIVFRSCNYYVWWWTNEVKINSQHKNNAY